MQSCVIFSSDDCFKKRAVDFLIGNYQKNNIIQIYSEKPIAIEDIADFSDAEIDSNDMQKRLSAISSDDLIIIVNNANKMYKRHSPAFSAIQHRIKAKHKILLQNRPYYRYPWELYFPYSCISKALIKYPHSYAIEQDYINFNEGMRESDPCAVDKLTENICEYTIADTLAMFKNVPRFNIMEVDEATNAAYLSLKESLFSQDGIGIAKIQKELYRFSKYAVFGHNMPFSPMEIDLHSDNIWTCSNLGIDLWIKSEIERMVTHTNKLVEVLNGKSLYK